MRSLAVATTLVDFDKGLKRTARAKHLQALMAAMSPVDASLKTSLTRSLHFERHAFGVARKVKPLQLQTQSQSQSRKCANWLGGWIARAWGAAAWRRPGWAALAG